MAATRNSYIDQCLAIVQQSSVSEDGVFLYKACINKVG